MGSTGKGRSGEFRYYIHCPVEGKKNTSSIKTIEAEETEEIIINHLLSIINRDGYLANIEISISDSLMTNRKSIETRKKELKLQIDEAESDIRKLVRIQIQAELTDLNSIYVEQLTEMKNKKQQLQENLNQIESSLGGYD